MAPDPPIAVEGHAGGRADEAPRRALVGGAWREVTVLGRWISESAGSGARLRWFRVRLAGAGDGLIYHDEALDLWFWRALPPGASR